MAATDSPLFSLCVISYNNKEFLPELFSSIASQTFSNWELVFVDDCSQDGTCEFVETQTIIPSEKITLLVNEQNQKQFKSREIAYAHARGKYALSIDSDDMLAENTALEKLAKVICTADRAIDVVLFNVTRDKNHMEPFADYTKMIGSTRGYVDSPVVFNALVSNCRLNNLSQKAIRLPLLDNGNLGDKQYKYYEDRLQTFLAFSKANSFYLLDENLYYYRLNPNSVTGGKFYSIESFNNLSEIESIIHHEAKRRNCDTSKELIGYVDAAGYAHVQLTRKRKYSQTIEHYKTISTNKFFRYAYENCDKESLSMLSRIAAKLAYDKGYFRSYLFAQLRRAVNFVYSSLFTRSK